MANTTMEEDLLLKKQIATAKIILFISAAVTVIAAILVVPQGLGASQLLDIILTLAQAGIYFALGLRAKHKPYTAIRIGLGLCSAMILASTITNVPALAGHYATRIITFLLLLLAFGDSRDAQRKMT